jgi:phosphoribosyl 1,2-cyclic phosphodiesterase
MPVIVKFWGVRGSIPTTAQWARVFGGNTPCVELRCDDEVFICDAGTGIRELGRDLARRAPAPKAAHLFLSHLHLDHIQGLPFFLAAVPELRVHVYGVSDDDTSRRRLLSGELGAEFFPQNVEQPRASLVFDHLDDEEPRTIGGTRVRSLPLKHPGGCHGFSFECDGRKVLYASDVDLDGSGSGGAAKERTATADVMTLRPVPRPLLHAARGADLLIVDGQYDDAQYRAHMGSGHSSCLTATDLAIQADVKQLALFHHDPDDRDADVEAKVKLCQLRAAKLGADFPIFAAREGVALKL